MAVTIKEVAAAAGVSVTTVSHVLSSQGRIGEETRQRVAEVAERLGYRANVHAQQLVTRRSRTIAIQVAPFDSASASSMLIPNSEYFLEVLNGASAAAADAGYALVLTPSGLGPASVSAFALDGAVIIDPHGDEGLLQPDWVAAHHVVTAGRPIAVDAVRHVVDNDHVGAAEAVLEHFWASGYRRPAAMVTDTARSYTRDLVAGYRAWCERRGVEPCVTETDTQASTAAVLSDLLASDDPPDAIYAGSEDIALDLVQACASRGLRIPEDLGICACVDSSTFTLTTPQVTGLFLNPREIGAQAVRLVVDLIEGRGTLSAAVQVPWELRVRQSTQRVATETLR